MSIYTYYYLYACVSNANISRLSRRPWDHLPCMLSAVGLPLRILPSFGGRNDHTNNKHTININT